MSSSRWRGSPKHRAGAERVAAELHTDIPNRFSPGMRLFALAADETRRELKVEELWGHKEWLVLKFAGVDSISEAEALIGCELQVPAEERARLSAGWNFVSDLAGCTVFDGVREIGTVQDVQMGAGEAPLLMVKADNRRVRDPLCGSVSEASGPRTPADRDGTARRDAGSERSTERRRKGEQRATQREAGRAKQSQAPRSRQIVVQGQR